MEGYHQEWSGGECKGKVTEIKIRRPRSSHINVIKIKIFALNFLLKSNYKASQMYVAQICNRYV